MLGRYVREKKALTLMDALRKMTVLPAERMRLSAKGQVREGFDADLVIFDENTVADCADFENPFLPPRGIEYVILAGTVAAEGPRVTDGSAGRYIHRKERHV